MGTLARKGGWQAFSCDFEASMDVMIAETSFVPISLRARVEEISLAYLQVSTWEITPQCLQLLESEMRCAEIEVDLGDGRMLQLRGRLVWIFTNGNRVRLTMETVGLTADQEAEFRMLLDELARKGRIVDLSDTNGSGGKTPTVLEANGVRPEPKRPNCYNTGSTVSSA
jgi:hypothetical protein